MQYGYSCVTSNEVVSAEPIEVGDVKEYLGIGFSQHDSALELLISSVRKVAEDRLSITLIDRRSVAVRWLEFNDVFTLPYQKLSGSVNITSLDGEYIDVDIIDNSGGLAILKGDFPDGVKLEYESVKVSENFISTIKSGLIRAVAEVFESHSISVQESVKKHLKGIRYAEV